VAVIDDDRDIVKVNMMILKSRGYESHCRLQWQEGLEMVGREAPDVVLLDIMMPAWTESRPVAGSRQIRIHGTSR